MTKERSAATRGENVRATLLRRLDDKFAGRQFDVVREVHLPLGQVFRTCMGALARHGYVLRDRESGETLAIGSKMLKVIHERYLGVNMPPKKRIRIAAQRINRGD